AHGRLGSVLVRAIDEVLGSGSAISVVSHVCLDQDGPAFVSPSKPIGPFFTASQVAPLARDRNWTMEEDAGRGFRRVVPSPQPGEFLEASAVAALLDVGKVVLAAGGGGIALEHTDDGR